MLMYFNVDNQFIDPKEIVADQGVTIQFTCSSHSQVYWALSLTDFIPLENNVIVLPNNTILIKNVQKINQGKYYCRGKTFKPAQEGVKKKFIDYYARAFLWLRGKMLLYYYLVIVVVVVVVVVVFMGTGFGTEMI